MFIRHTSHEAKNVKSPTKEEYEGSRIEVHGFGELKARHKDKAPLNADSSGGAWRNALPLRRKNASNSVTDFELLEHSSKSVAKSVM